MSRLRWFILAFLMGAVPPAFSQGNSVTILGSGAPAGGCAFVMYYVDSATGDFYNCPAGSWNKVTGAGSGTINSGATNAIPKYTAVTTLDDSLLTDDGTTLTYTGTGGFASGGTNGGLDFLEGTGAGLTAATSHDILWGDSTAHRLKVNDNNGGATTIALFTDALSVFATTTSSQLAGVISDETGTAGKAVFDTAPVFQTSITSPAYISAAADPADAGAIRLGNAELIEWEASPAAADITLTVNASEQFVFSNDILSPVLVTPRIASINDSNGNPFLYSSVTASAVDGVIITNAATANPATVTLGATGSDANIHLAFLPKGTGANLFNAGSAANPAIAFVGGTSSGFHFVASNNVVVYDQNGTAKVCLGCATDPAGTSTGGPNLASGATLGWSSTTDPTASSDTLIARVSAGTFGLGGSIAASPIDQVVRTVAARAGTDSNAPGSTFSLKIGPGTGTASPKTLTVIGDKLGTASGSAAHGTATRHIYEGTAALVSTVAKTIISIPLATTITTGGHVWYHIEGYNATDQCATDGEISYSAQNKAAVFVVNVSAIGTAATACSTGTLTVSWAMTSANPTLLQATATLSLGSPTAFRMVYEAANFGSGGDPTYTVDGQ